MTVRVCKADGETMPVVVVQNATVLELKKALRRHVQLRQARQGGAQHLSWKYIWRTYHLTYAGEKLADDRKKLREEIQQRIQLYRDQALDPALSYRKRLYHFPEKQTPVE